MVSTRALSTASSLVNLLRSNPSLTRATPFSVHYLHTAVSLAPAGSNTDSDSDSSYDSEADLRSNKCYYVPKVCRLLNPFLKEGPVMPFNVKQDDEAAYATLDMPGIGKEGLKLWVEDNSLLVRGVELGEGKEEVSPFSVSEESLRKYYGDFEIPEGRYKLGEIKAQLKNGVLKVKIPKLKLEERKDVINVNID